MRQYIFNCLETDISLTTKFCFRINSFDKKILKAPDFCHMFWLYLFFSGLELSSIILGDWSDWASWGECSTSCGVGMQRRQRVCVNSTGIVCQGEASEYTICNNPSCSCKWRLSVGVDTLVLSKLVVFDTDGGWDCSSLVHNLSLL